MNGQIGRTGCEGMRWTNELTNDFAANAESKFLVRIFVYSAVLCSVLGLLSIDEFLLN